MDQLNNLQSKIVQKKNAYVIKHPTRFSSLERSYYRISSLANSFADPRRFESWYITLAEQAGHVDKTMDEMIAIGKKLGCEVKDNQAALGTKMHAQIEKYYTNRAEFSEEVWKEQLINFYPFVKIFTPMALETRVFYENLFTREGKIDKSGKLIGMAGTFDGFGKVDGRYLSFERKGAPIANGEFLSVIDWKHPKSVKYPVKKYFDQVSYPLITYGLQLACYVAGINQCTNNHWKLNRAIVNIAPRWSKKDVRCKTNYPYYFSPAAINWFWHNIKKMLVAISYGDKKSFDYKAFEQETYEQGFCGTRLYYLTPEKTKK